LERLNLNLLRALVVLLECRNVTQAASRLHLTQSAMSRQLSQLRDFFADPLLIREQNDYLLSARAKQLLPKVQAILNDVDTLKDDEFRPDTCQRRFSFACTDYVAQFIFPGVLQRLKQQAPGIDLVYHVWKPEQLPQLGQLPLDFVSTTIAELPAGVNGIYLGQDDSVCLMASDHPLTQQQTASADTLCQYNFVKLNSGGDKDSFFDKQLEQHGLSRRIVFEVPYFSAAFSAVASSDYLMIVPEHIAHTASQHFALAYRPLAQNGPANRYHLCWHHTHEQDPAHSWLRNSIADEITSSMYSPMSRASYCEPQTDH